LSGRLVVKLEGDLVDDALLGVGTHDLVESSHSDLGMLTDVLVEGHEDREHDQVHSRVGHGLEGEDLLVVSLGLLELLGEFTDESLLDVTGALALLLRLDGELVTVLSAHSVHQSSGGEPARLTDEGITLGVLAEGDEGVDDLLRRNTDVYELIEEGGGLDGGDLTLTDLLGEVLDGVLQVRYLQMLKSEYREYQRKPAHLLDSLDVFLGGETKHSDDSGHLVSGSHLDSLLLSLHLVDDRLDETRDNLVLVLDLGIGGVSEEGLLSSSQELLLLLLPFHRVEEGLLLLALGAGDSVLLLVDLDESQVSRDEGGEEGLLLREGSVRIDGSEVDLLDQEARGSSTDTVVEE
ncbi:hypothetical protein PENTCL1PPCAC_27566, partial [Pristionchus entomophagus]